SPYATGELRAEQELVRTTRNGEVPTNTHDALKWRRSSERSIYDIHKTNFGAGVSHVRYAGSTAGQGNAAHLERPDNPSWQRRSDDYRGVSAGQFGPNPSPQCIWVYLCAGRLDRDAGKRRKGNDSHTWSDLLRRPG